jgi:hypothetical protein
MNKRNGVQPEKTETPQLRIPPSPFTAFENNLEIPTSSVPAMPQQRSQTDSQPPTPTIFQPVSAVEDNLFALGQFQHGGETCPDVPQIDAALTTARVFTMESKNLQLLTLYEQRLNRAIQKNLAMLQSLQAARKTQREVEMRQAANLLQLNEMRGLEYVPGRDGFVFSNDQIHAAIDREHRLQRAAMTDFSKHKRRNFQTQVA